MLGGSGPFCREGRGALRGWGTPPGVLLMKVRWTAGAGSLWYGRAELGAELAKTCNA